MTSVFSNCIIGDVGILKRIFKILSISALLVLALIFVAITAGGVWLTKRVSISASSAEASTLSPKLLNSKSKLNTPEQPVTTTGESAVSPLAPPSLSDKIDLMLSQSKSVEKNDPLYGLMIMRVMEIVGGAATDMGRINVVPVCDLVCASPQYNAGDQLTPETFFILKNFYEFEKNRAFEDYNFRMLILSFGVFSKFIPVELIETAKQLYFSKDKNSVAQAALVAKMQFYMAQAMAAAPKGEVWDELSKNFKVLEELPKLCKTADKRQVQERCSVLTANVEQHLH